jgi:hypothetical protein
MAAPDLLQAGIIDMQARLRRARSDLWAASWAAARRGAPEWVRAEIAEALAHVDEVLVRWIRLQGHE